MIEFIDILKGWSTDASLVLAAVGFVLSIGVALAAVFGVWRAAVENAQTQRAKRLTEEETHVLSLVKLSASMAEAKEFDLQLAAVSLLRHHPKYLPTMRTMRDRFEDRKLVAEKSGSDPHGTLAALKQATEDSISYAEGLEAAELSRQGWSRVALAVVLGLVVLLVAWVWRAG